MITNGPLQFPHPTRASARATVSGERDKGRRHEEPFSRHRHHRLRHGGRHGRLCAGPDRRPDPDPRERSPARGGAGEPRRAGHLRPRALPAQGTLVRLGRQRLQPGQLLQPWRQFEILRRGADPLPARRISTGVAHADGDAPAWPIRYEEIAPWYDKAEALYQVRGALGEDPTEPPHGGPYPHAPVPDEAAIAEGAGAAGPHRPAPLLAPARRGHRALAGPRQDTLGRLSGCAQRQNGRRDLRAHPGPRLSKRQHGKRRRGDRLGLAPDGKRIDTVQYRQGGTIMSCVRPW